MSGRANVDALTALLQRIVSSSRETGRVSAGTEWLACRLAAEGVLLPEALSEEELRRLADIGDGSMPDRAVEAIRESLTLMAKGETP